MTRFGSRWDPATDEVANPEPYDFAGAKRAHARASRDMTSAANFRADCAEQAADAEQAYRVALARRIVALHDDGMSWSAAQDVARGDETVARLRRERDVKVGLRDAAEQLAWKASADRRAVEQLVTWSMRVAPDGQREPS